jgi:hypothetical protein
MKKSQLRQIIKEEIQKSVNEGIENQIPGMREFLLFKSIMDTRTIKRADDEDQRRWADVTEDLDDTLTRWMDLLQELDKTYPS